jgi:asparaginyl-tRNA synthetase
MIDPRVKELLKQRTKVHEAEKHIGQEIVVFGWVMFSRVQTKRIFLKIAESRKSRMNPIQILFERSEETNEYLKELMHVSAGFSLLIKGLVVECPPEAKGQRIEIKGSEYHILGNVFDPSTFPSTKSKLTPDYVRSIEHLDCFVPYKSAIYSVSSEMDSATEHFFTMKEFTQRDMPLITHSECEGGCQPMQVTLFLTSGSLLAIPTIPTVSNLPVHEFQTIGERFSTLTLANESESMKLVDFSKDFFGKKAFLTVSSQLELETQLPQGSVWCVTIATRGEPSQTSRHLSTFKMIEMELISTGAEDIIEITIEYIKFCLRHALDKCREELEFLEGHYKKPIISKLEKYVTEDFAEITHAQAVELMLSQPVETFNELPTYDGDLSSEHEKFLTDVHFLKPVVVRKYPKMVKAFYMPVVKETPEESHGVEHVDCFDLLVPDVGELVGGSQRIDDYYELMERITELGLDPEPLKFYTDLRKYGSVPHGGMGLGFARLVKFITGAESVKDCVPFPRYIGSGK